MVTSSGFNKLYSKDAKVKLHSNTLTLVVADTTSNSKNYVDIEDNNEEKYCRHGNQFFPSSSIA